MPRAIADQISLMILRKIMESKKNSGNAIDGHSAAGRSYWGTKAQGARRSQVDVMNAERIFDSSDCEEIWPVNDAIGPGDDVGFPAVSDQPLLGDEGVAGADKVKDPVDNIFFDLEHALQNPMLIDGEDTIQPHAHAPTTSIDQDQSALQFGSKFLLREANEPFAPLDGSDLEHSSDDHGRAEPTPSLASTEYIDNGAFEFHLAGLSVPKERVLWLARAYKRLQQLAEGASESLPKEAKEPMQSSIMKHADSSVNVSSQAVLESLIQQYCERLETAAQKLENAINACSTKIAQIPQTRDAAVRSWEDNDTDEDDDDDNKSDGDEIWSKSAKIEDENKGLLPTSSEAVLSPMEAHELASSTKAVLKETLKEKLSENTLSKLRSEVASKKEQHSLSWDVRAMMQRWLLQNVSWPYPSTNVKRELAEASGLKLQQVANFMDNYRKRQWFKMFEGEPPPTKKEIEDTLEERFGSLWAARVHFARLIGFSG